MSVSDPATIPGEAPKTVRPDGPALSAVRRGHGPLGSVALQAGIVLVGAVVALLRVGGVPSWDSGYSDDAHIFLIDALAHPWHLLMPYGGYEELLPRLLIQLISYLPLVYVAKALASTGAIIDSLCALFIYHATRDLMASRWMRVAAALALLLQPLAPLEQLDNVVNTPWLLEVAFFVALFWRPRTRAGVIASGLVAFAAASSEFLLVTFAPVVLLRLFLMPRRWREQVVSICWAAGLVVQVPVYLMAKAEHLQRRPADHSLLYALRGYAERVLQRVPGMVFSDHLNHVVGIPAASAIVTVFVVAGLIWALATGTRRSRIFIVSAVVMGFIESAVTSILSTYANRYDFIDITFITLAALVAVDTYWQRREAAAANPGEAGVAPATRARRTRARVVVALLACLLVAMWGTGFRHTRVWPQDKWQADLSLWQSECHYSTKGTLYFPAPVDTVQAESVPCAKIVG
ncbi:MAG TPA: hypothetical protein VMU95_40235 [Trebonia sp.]|nr:hypothetical protein [Trebonia sp.]